MPTDDSEDSFGLVRLLAYLASILATVLESCASDCQPADAGHIFGDTILVSVLENDKIFFLIFILNI